MKQKSKLTEMPLTLASKIGSALIHADEAFSPGGHEFDKTAFYSAYNDPEVKAWLALMGPLLPVKRTK